MLQLKDIRKAYSTAAFVQVALDDVSITLRDNEFAAILGPSGSGKTTMLNILGGLDHADSGDIVINGVSTKDYTDKDWDAYRNHRVGFIFQSYNLIPHQTVLSNVELALTLAGVSASERRERARAALDRVGLVEHADKRPSQLSGGQMQRVAIARALVNDPEIVLADEPTGALDTDTGIQVMELLAEIARDRLVVMVTHNPELAEEYATRIVRLRDGRIVDDTNPIRPEEDPVAGVAPLGVTGRAGGGDRVGKTGVSDATRHASMSFLTALSLSFNNLMTKKGRTFMTAFAGSIGIIGIAAILALSNGVNDYIAKTEEEALSSYPLTITKSSFDLTSMMMAEAGVGDEGDGESGSETTEQSDRLISQASIMSDMFAQVKNNDLKAFGAYLKGGESGIEPYVSSIQYSYGLAPQIYKSDTSEGISRLNPSRMGQTLTNGMAGSAFLGGSSMSSFNELLDDRHLLEQSLDLVEGRWPESYDECVFVLGRNGGVTDYTLYSLGFYDIKVMDDMTTKALNGEVVEVPDTYEDFTLDDAMNMHFAVVPAARLYQRNAEQGTWTDMTGDKAFMRQAIADAIDLHVVGIVRPTGGSGTSGVTEGIGYTSALTLKLMDEAASSEIVREQMDDPEVDVFTGKTFEELQDEENRQFDMESVFSIDEDALRNAFSFDESALDGLGQGLDFSDLDLSSSMGSMDFSGIKLDADQIKSVFSPEAMAGVMNDPALALTEQDIQTALGTDSLTEEQQQSMAGIAQGFMPWYLSPVEDGGYGGSMDALAEGADLSDALQAYMQQETVQQVIAELAQSDVFQPDVSEDAPPVAEQMISQVMSYYLTNKLAPTLSKALGEMMVEAGNVIQKQLVEQLTAQMNAASGQIGAALGSAISSGMAGQMEQLSGALQSGFSVDAEAFANAIQFNMTQEDLTSLLTNYMNADELTYEGNLSKLGYAERESPDSISIFPIDFEAKEAVLGIIDDYNDKMVAQDKDDSTIQYSDIAGVLMSSVTDIVNTISLVLIAFVSISLVVSSIMISIITYISVLERKKEIGILRAMGASKLNVANIFNAETVIEGFFAGVLAVLVVYAASVPVNEIVYRLKDVPNIMQLPVESALALVGISVVLTLVAGLIPSSAAARRDPVEALRSE